MEKFLPHPIIARLWVFLAFTKTNYNLLYGSYFWQSKLHLHLHPVPFYCQTCACKIPVNWSVKRIWVSWSSSNHLPTAKQTGLPHHAVRYAKRIPMQWPQMKIHDDFYGIRLWQGWQVCCTELSSSGSEILRAAQSQWKYCLLLQKKYLDEVTIHTFCIF